VTEQTGDYILVEREDVVRALSSFIAEYIGGPGRGGVGWVAAVALLLGGGCILQDGAAGPHPSLCCNACHRPPACPPDCCAVSLPEGRSMDPKELQRAVAMTMAELRKGRVRRLVDWGKSLYRVGAIGYGAFSMFSNPWVAKAVVAALWSCLRLMGRLVL
jgi:hypothetical protein